MKNEKVTLIGGRLFEKYINNPCNHWRSLRIGQQWGNKDVTMNLDLDTLCEHEDGNWEVNKKELDYVVQKHEGTRDYAN